MRSEKNKTIRTINSGGFNSGLSPLTRANHYKDTFCKPIFHLNVNNANVIYSATIVVFVYIY